MISDIDSTLDERMQDKCRMAAKQPNSVTKALGTGAVAKVLQMMGRNPPPSTIQRTLQAYSTMPWLRAINDKIGSALASVRWRAYVRVEPGEKGKRKIVRDIGLQRASGEQRKSQITKLLETGELVELPSHPVISAIYNEGDNFTGVTLRELTQKYLDLVGEAFWIKVRNSEGMPVEFLPVPPHWVIETPRSNAPYFELNVPNSASGLYGEKVYPEDMIWFYHPDPFNPYLRGVGMGTTLADELETDEYAAKFLKSFFYNQARPDFLIHADSLSREDTVRLEQKWMDKLKGMFSGFTPFFSSRKLEVTRLTADYGHLQMLDLRAAQRDTCLQVYGAQPEIFGITQASNRATSEVAEHLFSRWVIVPRCDFLLSVLQIRLVPDFDENIILSYDSPIMHDKEHNLSVATIAPWSIDLDEWREMMGKGPLPDGKGEMVFCKPLNYEFYDIDDADEPPEEPVEPEPEEPVDDPPDGDDDESPEDDDTQEDAVAQEFVGYLEGVRGVAWIEVPKLEAMAADGNLDGVAAACREFLKAHTGLDRRLQKLVVLTGIRTAESLAKWLPKDAKLESYGPAAHKYAKSGTQPLHEFIKSAVAGVELALPALLHGMTPRAAVEIMAKHLGISRDAWARSMDADNAQEWPAKALDKESTELEATFPARLVADAGSFARLQVSNAALLGGLLAKKHIERVWRTSVFDSNIKSCRDMNGTRINGAEDWTLDSGDTVLVPTRSHPDCHCSEELVVNGGEV